MSGITKVIFTHTSSAATLVINEFEHGDVMVVLLRGDESLTVDLDPGVREELGLALLGLGPDGRKAFAKNVADSAAELILRTLGGDPS